MPREYFKCSPPLPTSHIVRKMHMNPLYTQHVITGFQAPLPPVCVMSMGNFELIVPDYKLKFDVQENMSE